MRRIDFPEWREVLTQAELPERLKSSFEITLRWYLSFCQRGRAEVTVQSARDFIAWAVEEKHPQSWGLRGLPGTWAQETCVVKARPRLRISWTLWRSING